MALSGSRLTTALHTDIKAQLVSIFGAQAGASSAQLAAIDANWDKLAQAIANASGPDVVTEITGHAVVPVTVVSVGGVTTGSGTSGAGTGTGTVT